MTTDSAQQADELSLSSLSINSQEDWDRSSSDIQFGSKPGSRPTTPKGGAALKEGETPGKIAKTKRRLAELLQKHTEDGKQVELTAEDEAKLSEELADWINSDSSPFEPDDDWFDRKAAEIKADKADADGSAKSES
ncbi:hypothetical protein EXIGLDRAFT_766760 [Exidia glandulosa HHB12029]|uniref:Uncharacterized protein n=1 Tax=Exidia glandulosa HHB12029 TaxID=1314781 RepID=A0A165JIE8_EXIGL|nr:hypothetical protein EXIGLDRAFT_766760 [Exidia glandulosa HHB12029]